MEKRFKYDFFISYKHEILDSAIAGYIQKKLERYKIPKEIQKKSGKKKITRVFRDREELSVTANLVQEIEEQLKNTEYLIVICSPESKQSIWVNREVETFIKYRGIECILPVLIKGEPEESFPEAIVNEEILAADVRGKNLLKIKRKCKYELLRLVAPTLQCSYDELKQRHKSYMFQRIAVAAIGIGIIVAGFATYVFYQAKQIDVQYQKAIRNQARYLSEISGELLNSGDRMGALKTALAILPKGGKSDEALVLEQESALNNALYSYTDNKKIYFRANRMEKTDAIVGGTLNTRLAGDFDEAGNYYVTIDNEGAAYFFSGEEGKCVWKLDPTKLTGEIEEEIYTYAIIDEDRVAFRLDKEIWIVSYKKKKVIKKIPLSGECEGEAQDRIVVDGDFLAFSDFKSRQIVIYNFKTGKQEYLVKYDKLGIIGTYGDEINTLLWNSQKKEIILAINCGLENTVGLVYYSFEKDECKILSKEETKAIALLDDKYLAAIQCKDYEYTNYEMKEGVTYTATSTYQFCIYDYTTGKRVWKEEVLDTDKIPRAIECMVIDAEKGKRILVFYAQCVAYFLDADTHEFIRKEEYGAEIVGIKPFDEKRILIGFKDREIDIMSISPKTFGVHISASQGQSEGTTGEIVRFAYNSKKQTVAQQYYREGKIVFLKILGDENTEVIDKDKEIINVFYDTVEQKGQKKTYRCIKYGDILSKEKQIIEIYEAGTSKLKYRLEAEKAGIKFNYIKIGVQGDKLLLCYEKEYSAEEDFKNWKEAELHIVDIEKGKEEKYCKLGVVGSENLLYTSDLSKSFIIDSYNTIEIDLTQDNLTLNTKKEGASKAFLSADNKYLVVTDREHDGDFSKDAKTSYYLKVWDLEKKKWKRLEGREKYKGVLSTGSVVLGKKKPIIAVTKENGEIEIFNISSGFKIATITVSGKPQAGLGYSQSFFDEDEYYIIMHNNKISMWNIQKGKQIMEKDSGDLWDCDIYTDGSSEYFALSQGGIEIYKVDKEHRFTKYTELSSAWTSFEGNEILWQKSNSSGVYYSKFHSFEELKKKAEKLLDGEILTEEEKNRYFISE